MAPPEVILDRWVKSRARRLDGCAGYVGKLDLDKVHPPTLGAFLLFVQGAMNMALGLENANASGGVEHPPFHFDYIEVTDGTKNAHAFQHDSCSFIVVTRPLIELLWDTSARLSRSTSVLRLLGLSKEEVRTEALHALLFQLQISFLVSHEYTHHVHQHCEGDTSGMQGLWTEFARSQLHGGMKSQAHEIDADAYALYLVLANFVRGGGRHGALTQIGRQHLSTLDGDSLILTAVFVAVMAFFCELWPEDIRTGSIWQLTHPPAPVRIDFTIRIAQMWCKQNQCVSESWFAAERFQEIFHAVLSTHRDSMREGWDSHVSFLQGEEGTKYNQELLDLFDTARRGNETPVPAT